MIEVNVINNSTNVLPKYETEQSAGCDVRANLTNKESLKFLFNAEPVCTLMNELTGVKINPMGRALIPTGLHVKIPAGYEIQVRPRSGLALKQGVTVANCVGTVDADYTGEIGVILINLSDKPVIINHGDRIAQLVLNKVEQISWNQVQELEKTERGEGGFGHTGKN